MANVYDVPPDKLIGKVAEELKKIDVIKAPEWAKFVKTGSHKARPPVDNNWWHVRAASILRTIYKLGPIGVSKMRTKYGGRKRRGYKPPVFRRGSGNIIRKILQQLEKAGLVARVEKDKHKGRIMTPKGKSFLDKIAVQVAKQMPKRVKVEKVEAKAEPKPEPKKKPAEQNE